MNYRTIDLAVGKEEARRHIAERVPVVTAKEVGADIEYLTPAGFHVATLSDVTLPDGRRGTRLKYRSVIVSSSAAHARRIAHEVRDAVVEYRHERDR